MRNATRLDTWWELWCSVSDELWRFSCRRKGTSKVHKAAVEERRQAATLASMRALPSLMRKHQTDPVQVSMSIVTRIISFCRPQLSAY
jgi:hypothetical protein